MCQILIADDELIERMVLYKTLKTYLGDICKIYQAENGREALKIYEEKKIQIAILDVEMPGINGIQTAEKIRETDPDCCIIFLTAYDEFTYAKKAITVRAMDYLLKPYVEEELFAVMDEAVRLTKNRENVPAPKEENADNQETLPEESADWGQVRLLKVSETIRDFVQTHFREELSMQETAKAMNYSEAYFCKLFKQCFSCNFTAYLTRLRMEEAKGMLEEPMVNVKEVGEAVGYNDSNYFAKVFKRHTGVTPSEYRGELFRQKSMGLDKMDGK